MNPVLHENKQQSKPFFLPFFCKNPQKVEKFAPKFAIYWPLAKHLLASVYLWFVEEQLLKIAPSEAYILSLCPTLPHRGHRAMCRCAMRDFSFWILDRYFWCASLGHALSHNAIQTRLSFSKLNQEVAIFFSNHSIAVAKTHVYTKFDAKFSFKFGVNSF